MSTHKLPAAFGFLLGLAATFCSEWSNAQSFQFSSSVSASASSGPCPNPSARLPGMPATAGVAGQQNFQLGQPWPYNNQAPALSFNQYGQASGNCAQVNTQTNVQTATQQPGPYLTHPKPQAQIPSVSQSQTMEYPRATLGQQPKLTSESCINAHAQMHSLPYRKQLALSTTNLTELQITELNLWFAFQADQIRRYLAACVATKILAAPTPHALSVQR